MIAICSGPSSIPYERVLREWQELGYADDVYEQVFHGNAERVLGL
jgi:predicted TIM-barrel fold metal-dependent hydrolase